MASEIRIGCSGWSYDDWKGIFYREDVRSMLREYARIFPTAEINASFYRVPDEGTVHGWARYTPDGFKLAAKVPQSITHRRKLRDVGEELAAFVRTMGPLREAGKLGPLLFQLPPSLAFDRALVAELAAQLPRGHAFALEPREPSWLAPPAVKALADARLALVSVDEPLLPPEVHVTADFAYFRWHGHGKRPWYNYEYSVEQLRPWVARIRKSLEDARAAFGYFNNHYHGFGPKNALQMSSLLGALSPEQKAKLAALEHGGEGGRAAASLDAFVPQEGAFAREVERLVVGLTDPGRIARAKEIAPRDLALSKVEPNFVRADVHGTRVVLDLAEQQVRHNCPDYLKGVRDKRVCKHIVRLLFALPPEIAREFADDLARSKDAWKFEPYWAREM